MQGENKLEAAEAHKVSASIWVFVIISFVLFLWLIIMNLEPEFYDDSYSFGIDFTTWIIVGSLIMIFFLVIIMVGYFPPREVTPEAVGASATEPSKTQENTPPVPEPDEAVQEVLVVEAEPVEVEAEFEGAEEVETGKVYEGPIKPKLIEYPKKVPGGVYGDTIVRVDYDTKLNLRTLLIRSCMICDREDKCWEEVKAFLDREKFLENIECKRGLRRKTKPTFKKKSPPKKKQLKRKEPEVVDTEVVEVIPE